MVALGIGSRLADSVNETIGWPWVLVLIIALLLIYMWPKMKRQLDRRVSRRR